MPPPDQDLDRVDLVCTVVLCQRTVGVAGLWWPGHGFEQTLRSTAKDMDD